MYVAEASAELEQVPFAIARRGIVMRAQRGNPREAKGVCNPGCVRGRDGALYLFPRLVAEGNLSSIGIARMRMQRDGQRARVERIGIALDPEARYERMSATRYGCEDARVTYVPLLDRYVMTYVALTPVGPRAALALSDDLFTWERLGLVDFTLEGAIDLNVYNNKDALLLPGPVMGPDGRWALALIHRPTYDMTPYHPDRTVELPSPEGVTDPRGSMWISYIDLAAIQTDPGALRRCSQHRVLATPAQQWDQLRIGGGAPPLLTHLGWLLIYHGVASALRPVADDGQAATPLRYSAGAMVLDAHDPLHVTYRSPVPILTPEMAVERIGTEKQVIFPTGIDAPASLGPGARVDVYYGMGDTVIGVGWLTLPDALDERNT